MSSENVVLVTGGTGSQGGATVTHLLAAKQVRVRVLTRNLESPKARSLAARGVELVKGDFDDVASLGPALAGVSAAFSVQQWTEKAGTAGEELRGKRFAEAVKASGSPHLVYSSAEGVERESGLGHYESKWAIEQHIRGLKIPATLQRSPEVPRVCSRKMTQATVPDPRSCLLNREHWRCPRRTGGVAARDTPRDNSAHSDAGRLVI